jgi:hypothetical protein
MCDGWLSVVGSGCQVIRYMPDVLAWHSLLFDVFRSPPLTRAQALQVRQPSPRADR